MNRKQLIAVPAIALAAGIGLAACSSQPASHAAAPAKTPASSSAPAKPAPAKTTAPAEPAATQAPAPTTQAPAPTQAPTTPAAPTMSVAEQQAVSAAQSYLSMGSGFSQESLLQQLTSSAGSGFSPADAQFAINYLNPDWNAQAVEAAKGYMQMGGFSASSLTQQLTSDAGNGFTEAQAAYAVAQVGL